MRGVSSGSLYGVSVFVRSGLVFAMGFRSRNEGSGGLLVLGCQSISLTIQLRYSSIGLREANLVGNPGFLRLFRLSYSRRAP